MPAIKELLVLHWELSKLLELGMNEKWLMENNITVETARDFVKGLLYLREKYPDEWKSATRSEHNSLGLP